MHKPKRMAYTTAQKLKIREKFILFTVNAPADFEQQLQPLPNDVMVADKAKNFDQVHWFVTNKSQLEKELGKILGLVKNEVTCWAYYPKSTSKIQTDLTRDKGWDSLLKHDEFQWLSLISFDDTWSAFGFRLKTEKDTKKASKPQIREIFTYIDPVTKEVYLPDDLALVLTKHPTEELSFNNLSFSNKKEYVEWIITAKRDETRKQRIAGTIERLAKGWNNPANR